MRACVYNFLLLSYYCVRLSSCIWEIRFLAGRPQCHGDKTLSDGCARMVLLSKNSHQCLASCYIDWLCIGVTMDKENKTFCVVHYECTREKLCLQSDPNRRFYSKNCAHDGRWVPSENRCRCVDGWVGARCQDMPKDYTALLAAGYPNKTMRTYLDLRSQKLGLVPVQTVVSYEHLDITLLEHRGSVNFNQSWTDYQDGFSVDLRNMWARFCSWRALNAAGYNTVYVILYFKAIELPYHVYENASVSRKYTSYAIHLNVSRSSGSGAVYSLGFRFEDCFSGNQGIPFSTFDKDLDGDPTVNCAARVGSGWWYQDGRCSKLTCNLFGWGPANWNTRATSPQQRLTIPGVPDYMMTGSNFDYIHMYTTIH